MSKGIYTNMWAFVFLTIAFISCRNTKKELTVKQLDNLRKEFNLPEEKTYRLDRSYLKYLFSFDTIKYSSQIQNHYQPVQAIYYNKNGDQVSFHTNCYASTGSVDAATFNWNLLNAFDSFIPKTVAPIDSILSLDKHLSFIKAFNNKPIDTTSFSSYDYTIVVHWCKKLYPEGSKKLIQAVNNNLVLAAGKRINVIYVNNDDLW